MNAATELMPTAATNIVPISDNAAMMATITRAAADPNVDIEKMERLWAMKERMDARAAEVAYADAFAEMQLELPAIEERGKAEVNGSVRYTFAKWEDMNTAIKPVLSKHGFALSFRTDFTNGITVIGVLQHRLGHREDTSITLPSDKSGSKNDVQAIASAVSYGKRYTAGALLNLTSHGEDDDAYSAGKKPRITEEQAATLRDMLEATKSNVTAFLGWLKVASIEEIPAQAYQHALAALKAKEQGK